MGAPGDQQGWETPPRSGLKGPGEALWPLEQGAVAWKGYLTPLVTSGQRAQPLQTIAPQEGGKRNKGPVFLSSLGDLLLVSAVGQIPLELEGQGAWYTSILRLRGESRPGNG